MCSETLLGVFEVPKIFLYIQNTNQIDISNDFVQKIHFYGKFKILKFCQKNGFFVKIIVERKGGLESIQAVLEAHKTCGKWPR